MAELRTVADPHLYVPGVNRDTGLVECSQCGRPFSEHTQAADPDGRPAPVLPALLGLSDEIAARVAIARIEAMASELDTQINLDSLWRVVGRRPCGREEQWEADCGLVLAALNLLNEYRRGRQGRRGAGA